MKRAERIQDRGANPLTSTMMVLKIDPIININRIDKRT